MRLNVLSSLDKNLEHIQSKLDSVISNQMLLARRVNEISNQQTINLGDHLMITALRNGQRMFIDGRDTGSGMNIITDGRIEPPVMKVLQRFFKPNSVFLDIGTNFGFYTMLAGSQNGPDGHVYSFEANPFLIDFIRKSAYVNGVIQRTTIVNKAVSDQEGIAKFGFSYTGIGGGSLAKGSAESADDQLIEVPLVPIDSVLPSDVVVECAKLDVEGNEAATLRGMREVIARSPDIKLVLEFFPSLLKGHGSSDDVLSILEGYGLQFWRIDPNGHLEDVTRDDLNSGGDSYLVAARNKPDTSVWSLEKPAFNILARADSEGWLTAAPGEVISHGPYWFLPAGAYEVEFVGDIRGDLRVAFTLEFGFEVASATLTAGQTTLRVPLMEDARFFEIVLRGGSPGSAVRLDRIEVRDL
jgi:FkbM family methyltransferase